MIEDQIHLSEISYFLEDHRNDDEHFIFFLLIPKRGIFYFPRIIFQIQIEKNRNFVIFLNTIFKNRNFLSQEKKGDLSDFLKYSIVFKMRWYTMRKNSSKLLHVTRLKDRKCQIDQNLRKQNSLVRIHASKNWNFVKIFTFVRIFQTFFCVR